MTQKSQKPTDVDINEFLKTQPVRQKMSAIILLYISNMLTDFQLNKDFKFNSPHERQLWLSLRELVNLNLEIKEETLKLK